MGKTLSPQGFQDVSGGFHGSIIVAILEKVT
jgi:hypothetical protein